MTISFDFDGVLAEYKMQQLAKKFINSGMDVWVITSRKEGDFNKDLVKVLDKIRLPIQKVVFTNKMEKHTFVAALNCDLHIDDSQYECDIINSWTNFVALCYDTLPTRS